MIRINLLPQASARSRRGPSPRISIPTAGSAGVLIVLLAVIAFPLEGWLGYKSFSKVAAARKSLQDRLNDKKKLEDTIAGYGPEADEIKNGLLRAQAQLEILQSLDPRDRILWSEKLAMLAKLIPANVFLTDVQITEDYKEVELQSSIQARTDYEASLKKKGAGGKTGKGAPSRAGKPEAVFKPSISYTLKLVGLTTGADPTEQLDHVNKFHDALVNASWTSQDGQKQAFMDHFNPEIAFEYVQASLYQKQYPVQQFSFKLTTKPMTAEEKKPESDAETTKTAPAQPKKNAPKGKKAA